MSANEQAAEPSMEEILASIRKIISDDEEAAPEEAQAEEPAAEDTLMEIEQDQAFEQAEAASEMDEVADVFEAAPAEAAPEEPADFDDLDFDSVAEEAPEEDDDVLELGTDEIVEDMALPQVTGPDPLEDDLDFSDPAPAPAFEAPAPVEPSAGSLMSADANAAVSAAFGNLANTILSNDARTLEDLVAEMLRPMLKGWMDENLPPLVERLVREEIERVARGRR